MSFLDTNWGSDLTDSIESLNHAPVQNTMTYGDNHGETTTKAFMLAALAYATGLGGFAGFGGGEGGAAGGAAGGAGGGSGTGGALSMYGPSAIQNVMRLFGGGGGGGGGQQQSPFSPPMQQQAMTQPQQYRPMQFQNQSFNPWLTSVAQTENPRSFTPQSHIFSPGRGLF